MKRRKDVASIAMRFPFRVLAMLWMGSIIAFAEDPGDAVVASLDRIVIPKIDFHDTTVEEAVNFIALRMLDQDPDQDPGRRGISVFTKPPTGSTSVGSNKRITCVAESVSPTRALTEIARLADLDVHLTDVGIVICQAGDPPFPNAKAAQGSIWKTIHKTTSPGNGDISGDHPVPEDAGTRREKWREAIGGAITGTKEKLGELDTAKLMAAAKGLAEALKSSDFSAAQGYADKVDRHCGTKSVGACLRAMIVQSQEGTEKAGETIETFVRITELTAGEREFFKKLPAELAKSTPAERMEIVSAIVYIACESKYGKGGGALPEVLGKALKPWMGREEKPAPAPGGAMPDNKGQTGRGGP